MGNSLCGVIVVILIGIGCFRRGLHKILVVEGLFAFPVLDGDVIAKGFGIIPFCPGKGGFLFAGVIHVNGIDHVAFTAEQGLVVRILFGILANHQLDTGNPLGSVDLDLAIFQGQQLLALAVQQAQVQIFIAHGVESVVGGNIGKAVAQLVAFGVHHILVICFSIRQDKCIRFRIQLQAIGFDHLGLNGCLRACRGHADTQRQCHDHRQDLFHNR